MAGSELNLAHLHKIHDRDGEDGLRNIFCVKNSEHARVTSVKRIIEEVIPKLAEYLKSNQA